MKRLLSFLSAGVIAIAAYSTSSAQTSAPQLLITWSTQSYTPAWYQGKLLPGADATVHASAQLLDNGLLVDMSKYQIAWRLNDRALASGAGIAATSFTTTDPFTSTYILEARIKKYKNGSDIIGSVTIPKVRPFLIIDAPYPDRFLSRSGATLRALPFFFNITSHNDLDFNWRVNDLTSTGQPGDPSLLSFAAEGSGSSADVSVSVRAINPKNPAEAADVSALFSIQ